MIDAGKLLKAYYMLGAAFRKTGKAAEEFSERYRAAEGQTPESIKKTVRRTLHEIRRRK